MTLVTVIIAVRDGARFIAEALDSVLAQTHRPLDVLVIDGHSSDGTADIVRRYPSVRLSAQRGRGIADAYNQGISEAHGELVSFLSHDDRWLPHKLALQVALLEREPQIDVVCAAARHFLEKGSALPPGFRPELLERDHAARLLETMVARRSIFERVGLFDTSFTISEDVDWFLRLSDAGLRATILPDVVLEKRVHDRNASLDASAPNRDLLEAVRRSVARKKRRVSVVIPVRDGERTLAAAVESVLHGAVAPFEVIVVDDGSTDGSVAVAERFGPPVRVVRQAPAGPSAARAHGVSVAAGDWLAFLDADDLWTPDKLAVQLAALDRDPSLDAVFGRVVEFVEGERRFKHADGPIPGPTHGTILLRRAAYDRAGPFRADLRYGDFLDWYGRAQDVGLRMISVDDVVMRRRIHGENLGIREPELRARYLAVLKATLDRRRGK